MRIFFALPLPDHIRESLRRFAETAGVAAGTRGAVRSDNYHLTLQFIGEVSPERAVCIADRFRAQFDSMSPELRRSRSLRLSGFGYFPDAAQPAVFWAGVAGADWLLPLVHCAAEASRNCGSMIDTRPFKPHITISRIFPRSVRPRPAPPGPDGAWSPSSIVLYESIPGKGGSAYRTLREYLLFQK